MVAPGAPSPPPLEVGGRVPFCERCGREVRASTTLPKPPLRWCPFCYLHACDDCWASTPGACPGCGVRVDVASPLRRRSIARPPSVRVAAAIGAAAVVVLAVGLMLGRPSDRSAGVLGETATPPAIAQANGTASVRSPGFAMPSAAPPSATGGIVAPSTQSSIAVSPAPSGVVPASRDPGPSGSPGPAPGISVAGAWFRGWSEGGEVTRGQVLAVVKNDTATWVTLPTGKSGYAILDGRGRQSASGVFAYAFPQVVAPGGRAYLVDMIDASFKELATLVEVRVDPVFAPADPIDDAVTVRDVRWREEPAVGLTASGTMTNAGADEQSDVVVGVVFLDARSDPLRVQYDPEPVTLRPGESRHFQTAYPDAGPVRGEDVSRIEVIARPYRP